MVGDDVVQLAGDPLTLLPDRLAVAVLPLQLEAARPLLRRFEADEPVPRPRPEDPRREDRQLRLDEARSARPGAIPRDRRARRQSAAATRATIPDVRRSSCSPTVNRATRNPSVVLSDSSRASAAWIIVAPKQTMKTAKRPATPGDQRHRLQHEQDEAERVVGAEVLGAAGDRDERQRRQPERDERVDRQRVRREAPPRPAGRAPELLAVTGQD